MRLWAGVFGLGWMEQFHYVSGVFGFRNLISLIATRQRVISPIATLCRRTCACACARARAHTQARVRAHAHARTHIHPPTHPPTHAQLSLRPSHAISASTAKQKWSSRHPSRPWWVRARTGVDGRAGGWGCARKCCACARAGACASPLLALTSSLLPTCPCRLKRSTCGTT